MVSPVEKLDSVILERASSVNYARSFYYCWDETRTGANVVALLMLQRQERRGKTGSLVGGYRRLQESRDGRPLMDNRALVLDRIELTD